jgi:hypothetical protein
VLTISSRVSLTIFYHKFGYASKRNLLASCCQASNERSLSRCGQSLHLRGDSKNDADKQLLLFGGAIQLAGEVKARGERRRGRSDWTPVERERGISVSSAVINFEHGLAFPT